MRIEPLIGFADQLAIKPSFAAAGLVAGHQQNRLALGVEGEGDTPDCAGRGVLTGLLLDTNILSVVTRNGKDFVGLGLMIVNPWDL
jgi:hypothetical protein